MTNICLITCHYIQHHSNTCSITWSTTWFITNHYIQHHYITCIILLYVPLHVPLHENDMTHYMSLQGVPSYYMIRYMRNTCAIIWFITYSITYNYMLYMACWSSWSRVAIHTMSVLINCVIPSQNSSWADASPQPTSSGTGWSSFRYVFNAVLSASRCSAWNLRRPAKCCSSSALGNTCCSTNGNVR